jgi:hypothetical protein
MPEVLVSNDDITVLGPPSTIELLVDIGPQGTRGSQTFVGTGNPNSIEIGQTVNLNDLFINTSPGADYAYLYQYVSEPGGNTWTPVLKMNPVIFSKNYSVTFTSGSGSVVIPIDDITAAETAFVADNFSVQYSIAHTNPIASSMAIPAIAGSNLTINLEAVEYASSTWSALDEEVVVHIFITIVEAGES